MKIIAAGLLVLSFGLSAAPCTEITARVAQIEIDNGKAASWQVNSDQGRELMMSYCVSAKQAYAAGLPFGEVYAKFKEIHNIRVPFSKLTGFDRAYADVMMMVYLNEF